MEGNLIALASQEGLQMAPLSWSIEIAGYANGIC
jgi:hypothetical protein